MKFVKWGAVGHPTSSCMRELPSREILTDFEPKTSQAFQKSLFLILCTISTVLPLYQKKQMRNFVTGRKFKNIFISTYVLFFKRRFQKKEYKVCLYKLQKCKYIVDLVFKWAVELWHKELDKVMTNRKFLHCGICHGCKSSLQLWFYSCMCFSTAVELHPAIISGVVFHRSSPGLEYFVSELILVFVI